MIRENERERDIYSYKKKGKERDILTERRRETRKTQRERKRDCTIKREHTLRIWVNNIIAERFFQSRQNLLVFIYLKQKEIYTEKEQDTESQRMRDRSTERERIWVNNIIAERFFRSRQNLIVFIYPKQKEIYTEIEKDTEREGKKQNIIRAECFSKLQNTYLAYLSIRKIINNSQRIQQLW